MKRNYALVCAVVLGFTLGMFLARAQDPLVAAPDMYRVLFENERVRVMEVTFQPGQKIAEHSHPAHFVYVAEAGNIRVYKPDGSSMDAELEVGQVVWFDAETHWAENTGSTVIRLIVSELKEAASVSAE